MRQSADATSIVDQSKETYRMDTGRASEGAKVKLQINRPRAHGPVAVLFRWVVSVDVVLCSILAGWFVLDGGAAGVSSFLMRAARVTTADEQQRAIGLYAIGFIILLAITVASFLLLLREQSAHLEQQSSAGAHPGRA
ncbi:MAG: hypothetical protein JNM66_20230 [Bryobacterales bacterium]|nr:hypothetical protein [Bryobacterales bacterium]